jgi:ADP-heptose:LPS heptosyltransferase
MNQADFEFMKSFMLAQEYITEFTPLDRNSEVTHNLDRFRNLFVDHSKAGNYVDCYANTFGITDTYTQMILRTTPWLTVPTPRKLEGKVGVVNRTARWQAPTLPDAYAQWREQGVDRECVFVGLPEEYEAFKKVSSWDIDYYPTPTLLDLAEVIAGADTYIGNQSLGLSLAIGLGTEYFCEARRDLAIERNECYFPFQPKGHYI